MSTPTPTLFNLAEWLGNDTYGFTSEPQEWRIVVDTAELPPPIAAMQPVPIVTEDVAPLSGQELLPALASDLTTLGANTFQSLALAAPRAGQRFKEEQLPKEWLQVVNGRPTKLLFLGTQLENRWGHRAVLFLSYRVWLPREQQRWLWGLTYLHNPWYPDYLALTLNE